ncbi:hypothetical protein IWQ61_009999 [Dispira simplex]|nr:hypothetical protein IWQ61_009999 [Dispira simplex]
MKEWRSLQKESAAMYTASPLEDNMFEWHFTIKGQSGTEFEQGKYHGRILLPTEYPFKPPSIVFLTPNGRFQLHNKICLTMTQYHPEQWQPAWDIRCILLALISYMPSEVSNSVGDLNYSAEQRKQLAKDNILNHKRSETPRSTAKTPKFTFSIPQSQISPPSPKEAPLPTPMPASNTSDPSPRVQSNHPAPPVVEPVQQWQMPDDNLAYGMSSKQWDCAILTASLVLSYFLYNKFIV